MKAVSGIMLTLLLIGMLTLNIQTVRASGTIYIRADGSVDPPTANITSSDNVTYTFTDNNYGSIIIETNNIVVDGAGYTLQGIKYVIINEYGTIGIELSDRSNVTIKNMEIKDFTYGIRLDESSNNTIFGNNITAIRGWARQSIGHAVIYTCYGIRLEDSSNNSIYHNDIAHTVEGIALLTSSNNSIFGNNISNLMEGGIGLWEDSSNNIICGNNLTNNRVGIAIGNSLNNVISGNNIINNSFGIELLSSLNGFVYHNNFINNTQQVYCLESTNAWDDGGEGNHWSDYEGVDYTGDGIGDSPYVIDENNQDNHPLMSPWTPTWRPIPFWMQWWFWTIVVGVIITFAGTVYFLKKRKPPTPTAPPTPP